MGKFLGNVFLAMFTLAVVGFIVFAIGLLIVSIGWMAWEDGHKDEGSIMVFDLIVGGFLVVLVVVMVLVLIDMIKEGRQKRAAELQKREDWERSLVETFEKEDVSRTEIEWLLKERKRLWPDR